MTAILGLPLMALGQTAEPQQTQAQGQTKETQATAPAKGKKMRPAQEPNKPQTKSTHARRTSSSTTALDDDSAGRARRGPTTPRSYSWREDCAGNRHSTTQNLPASPARTPSPTH